MEHNNQVAKREAERKHKEQFIWQILLPILVAVLLALAIGILSILTAGQEPEMNEKWAQIATILLIVPILLLGLILFVLIILSSQQISKFTKFLSPYLVIFSTLVDRTGGIVMDISGKTVQPLIQAKSYQAGIKRLFDLAFHTTHSGKE